tara:strand:+ start:3615 stop:4193 length:579 start_codon:yes stop_codon:yes gene_type:complete
MKDKSISGATRNKVDGLRYDLLVWEFIDEMAAVMAEGAKSHGEPGDDGHWQKGFDDEGRDIWNHIYNHQRQWREGDTNEPHLAKIAIGAMFQWYFDKERTIDLPRQQPVNTRDATPTFAGDGCDPYGSCGPEAIGMSKERYDAIRYSTPEQQIGQDSQAKSVEELLGERYADRKVHTGHDTDGCSNQGTESQ